MSLFYTMVYWLGFAPWEHAATHILLRRGTLSVCSNAKSRGANLPMVVPWILAAGEVTGR